jgi:hypothetical protein
VAPSAIHLHAGVDGMLHLCIFMAHCGKGNIRGGLGTTSFRASITELTKANLQMRHTTNPSKMNANCARYHVSTGIGEIIGDGARRRTCGCVYSPHRDISPGFCISHGYTMEDEEARLGHIGVRLQDTFYAFSKLEFEKEEKTMVPEPEGMTETERWTWLTMNVLFDQCERSHVFLAPFWRLYEGGINGSRE